MKTSFLLPSCFAATLFLTVGLRAADADPTSAVPDDQAATPKASAAHQAELLKRFDKNGDGKLDDTEKAAAKAEMQKHGSERKGKMRERALELYDKNGDGKLDETERAAAMADIKSRPRVIKRFDKDGDGKLNAEEEAAAEKAIRERISQHLKDSAATTGEK